MLAEKVNIINNIIKILGCEMTAFSEVKKVMKKNYKAIFV